MTVRQKLRLKAKRAGGQVIRNTKRLGMIVRFRRSRGVRDFCDTVDNKFGGLAIVVQIAQELAKFQYVRVRGKALDDTILKFEPSVPRAAA